MIIVAVTLRVKLYFLFVITFLKAIGELRATYKIYDSNKFIQLRL
jgi:hypothetical protein